MANVMEIYGLGKILLKDLLTGLKVRILTYISIYRTAKKYVLKLITDCENNGDFYFRWCYT